MMKAWIGAAAALGLLLGQGAASAQTFESLTAQAKQLGAKVGADSADMGATLQLIHGGGHRGGGDWGRRGPRFPGNEHGLPEHRGPEHRFPHHRGDWGRWNGHPGWGYHHSWRWEAGRPIWWGWAPFVVVIGATRASCVAYYDGLRDQCGSACVADNGACESDCAAYAPGDAACVEQCGANYNDCSLQCGADRDNMVLSCPF